MRDPMINLTLRERCYEQLAWLLCEAAFRTWDAYGVRDMPEWLNHCCAWCHDKGTALYVIAYREHWDDFPQRTIAALTRKDR